MTSPPVMHNEIIIPEAVISDKIYVIRGQKVMLDKDLAELYHVETKVLNQAVKRNLNRFPEDFMFQLNQEEYNSLRSQFVTLENGKGNHRKYLPYVFTEHGVLMLSSVLRSDRAVAVNIHIMRVYKKLKEMVLTHKDILLELEEIKKKMIAQDEKIEVVFDYLTKFVTQEQEPREQIGFRKSSK